MIRRTTDEKTAIESVEAPVGNMTVMKVLILTSLAMSAFGLSPLSGTAQAAPHEEASAQCRSLEVVDFAQILDAPTQITETKLLDASGNTPGYCRVSGYVSPNVGLVLALPSTHWNGKFIELGCGAFCGSTEYISSCEDPLRRGYACIISDMGHKSTGNQALWAYNNLQAEIDHAYRSAHVTALAGKAIVERYYGQAPAKAYFIGTSTGGRQAMLEAQRFPWDFDGIVAGVPSLSVTGIHLNLLWDNRAFTDQSGEPLFTQSDLDVLHRAVVKKCDLNDGVQDGLIGDPRTCGFDPSTLLCTGTRQTECLTGKQVEAVQKIYGGAVTSKGEPIYMPAALKGSEATWLDFFGRGTYNFVREEFRYSAFQPNAGPAWKPEDFDFDRNYKRMGIAEGLSAAVNPDLRQFKALGGKLIMWAGWSDAGGMPLHTVDYYETAERTSGGRAATQEFLRLFMLPGVGHGWGEGAFAVDWLTYLDAWVEQGRAPDKVISSHVKIEDLTKEVSRGDQAAAVEMERRTQFPLDVAMVEFSRPVYPYPTLARYLGDGDPKDAASFGPVEPYRH